MPENVSYSRIPADAAERWQAVRDVCAGDQALRCDHYLPFLNAQDKTPTNIARNSAYRERAVLYTATGFTLEGLIGLAFSKDPRSDLPAALEYLLRDADGAGTSIYQQSQSVLASNVSIGRHGLYVDFSEALAHPVIKSYRAEDIINWRHTMVGGKTVLSMVVLREEVDVDDGYGVVSQKQYRELVLIDGQCVCRVWIPGEKPEDPPVQAQLTTVDGNAAYELVLRSKASPLDYVPFQFVGSQNNDASIDPSPLYGLAKVNIAHFRNSADFEDSVFYVGQAQAWISGLDEQWRNWLVNPTDDEGKPIGQAMYIGSRTPLMLPVNGAFGFAQPEANTLVEAALRHKEEQMIALGARLIEASKANKTATGEDNDREATTSVLALCVSNVSEAYQNVINWCARYLDITLTAEQLASSYKINQEFVRLTADAQIVAALVAAWQTGVMAKNDVRAFLRRAGLIATERTDQAIDGDIEQEGPPTGTIDNANGQ